MSGVVLALIGARLSWAEVLVFLRFLVAIIPRLRALVAAAAAGCMQVSVSLIPTGCGGAEFRSAHGRLVRMNYDQVFAKTAEPPGRRRRTVGTNQDSR